MFDWLFGGKKKVGLVLGGGVARGLAHIGVLKVLIQNKVPIDYVVGTSSGSLIGAAFAAGMDVAQIEKIAMRIRWRDMMKLTFFQAGLNAPEAIEDFVVRFIGDRDFREMKIPFAAVATDIKNGARVVIDQGGIAKAVAASATFPGVFSPVEINGHYLIDGGIAANVPVDVAKQLGADFVIASDVIPSRYIRGIPNDPLSGLGRALDLMFKQLSYAERQRADILIELQMEEEDIWHLDLHKAEKLITAGEIAAHRAINKIKKALKLPAGS
ncbi:hypothetical protein A2311_01710 [candidate division WOR-1 bacterium RIFOXYB2_FULL_48_7]|uniref:PNPLA domain-containing protein n=1 Tax=candidate division WOR-1 bacterium RIFOXYB2_FULL_48_7 TaxID=1802583 RepID=A0A1F4TS37_UNCSA|nr:MAG: hypothetical protein A2311_01710 [candidate division WOR-1 bacterium RIFOXYB2_FULL_48_7]